jgi:glucose-1-phosphate thymidylyltransferase
LQQASAFVQAVQDRQGLKIACVEEIAFRKGYIGVDQLRGLAKGIRNEYGEYLLQVAEEG